MPIRPERDMTRFGTSRLLLFAGALLVTLHVWHDAFGLGAVDRVFSEWFMPVAFLASGAAALAGARRLPGERTAWLLLGAGLVLYAAGSVFYSLACMAGKVP